jgi:cobalt-zinc-cadmium efflux system outer membrane protein
VRQAGRWPNPEISADIEEFGWDAPGLSESELSVSLVQEFEVFGQRGARQRAARADAAATRLRNRIDAFDLYLEAKRRFYAVAHAQDRLQLADSSVGLAQGIVDNIVYRINKGAALQSELLLAQLEQQRAVLVRDQARRELAGTQALLQSLWAEDPGGDPPVVAADREPAFNALLSRASSVAAGADSARAVLQLQARAHVLSAARTAAAAEARPRVTLSGGIKRLQANRSNAFVLGVGLPLPFWNRNQDLQASLDAERRSVSYETDRAQREAVVAIRSSQNALRQLIMRHQTLDSLLLPTAEEAYRTLQSTYEAGRVPYTQLLEAERSLIELRYEHTDLLLEIHEQIITLEGVTGVTLRTDKELQSR